MRRVRGIAVWLVASLVAACTATPGASAPPASTVGSDGSEAVATPAPAQASPLVAEADGYTLTVTADRLELAPGDTVTFSTTFHNGTDKPIDVASAGCGSGSTGFVSVPLPVEPKGKTWSGVRQAFKDYVLSNAMGPGIVPAFDPLPITMSGSSCSSSTVSSELGPGESLDGKLTWKAEIVAGVDALAGAVPFSVSVAYDQRNGPPSYAPDYSGPLISWSPIFRSLTVNGQLEIVGQGNALKSAGEVIDGALANEKFVAWLARRPATTWSNTNLFLTSSRKAQGILPKGPSWELDLFREHGVPRNWATAFIDPFDASFISATYCDVPCDR